MGRGIASHSAGLQVTLLYPTPNNYMDLCCGIESPSPSPSDPHSLLFPCSHLCIEYAVQSCTGWALFSFPYCLSPCYLLIHYAYVCKGGEAAKEIRHSFVNSFWEAVSKDEKQILYNTAFFPRVRSIHCLQ